MLNKTLTAASGPHVLVLVNERTGERTNMCEGWRPMTCSEAYTVRSKFTARPGFRIQVESVARATVNAF